MSVVNEQVVAYPDHPDLPYKPPLPFIAAMLAGSLIHRYWPAPVRPLGWATLGLVIGALGVLLLAWAMLAFRAKRTPLEPWKATKAIVDFGPFAYSRNPVYIGFALIQVGAGVWRNSAAVVALVVLPVLATALVVVPREERYLRRKFGAEYEAYCARVRRWL